MEGFLLTVLLLLLNTLPHLDHMKKQFFIPIIFLLVINTFVFAQTKLPVKKIYGYKQASIPGILPEYSEENDIKPAGKNKPKQNFNYWFYIECLKTEKIKITGLWISGIKHDIKSDTITNLPVKKIIFTGMQKDDTVTMAPVTKNKIVLVYPSGESKINDSRYASALASSNELVIRYIWKNKTYYTTIKKLKELNPDVRQ